MDSLCLYTGALFVEQGFCIEKFETQEFPLSCPYVSEAPRKFACVINGSSSSCDELENAKGMMYEI